VIGTLILGFWAIYPEVLYRVRVVMFSKCPGASNIRSPTIEIKKCPECGEEVEIFTDEFRAKCEKCGFTVFNDIQSCIQWCKYAKDCVGEDVYEKFVED